MGGGVIGMELPRMLTEAMYSTYPFTGTYVLEK
jgi:hypothetical protein